MEGREEASSSVPGVCECESVSCGQEDQNNKRGDTNSGRTGNGCDAINEAAHQKGSLFGCLVFDRFLVKLKALDPEEIEDATVQIEDGRDAEGQDDHRKEGLKVVAQRRKVHRAHDLDEARVFKVRDLDVVVRQRCHQTTQISFVVLFSRQSRKIKREVKRERESHEALKMRDRASLEL